MPIDQNKMMTSADPRINPPRTQDDDLTPDEKAALFGKWEYSPPIDTKPHATKDDIARLEEKIDFFQDYVSLNWVRALFFFACIQLVSVATIIVIILCLSH